MHPPTSRPQPSTFEKFRRRSRRQTRIMLTGTTGCLVILPWLVSLAACDILFGRQSIPDSRTSDHEYLYGNLHRSEDAANIVRDMFEAPSQLTWLFISFSLVGLSTSYSRSLEKTKHQLLQCLFATSLIVQFLSIFSSMLNLKLRSKDWIVPWLAISPLNILVLTDFIDLRAWEWTSLGIFLNNVWEGVSGDPAATDCNRIFRPRFDWTMIWNTTELVSTQDAIIRLAYYHLFENAVRVLCLRYYRAHNEGAPYTTYVNNSEILTGLLALQVAAWTYCKMRENAKTLGDIEKGAAALQMGPIIADRL